jgi:hypothetical protein
MKDTFHLVDLVSQVAAVQYLLNGKSVAEKLAWLSEHGKLSKMDKKTPPDTCVFESTTGMECTFVVQGNACRFVGDHCLSTTEF